MDNKPRKRGGLTKCIVAWLAILAQASAVLPSAAQTNAPYRDRAPEFQELIDRIAQELERSYGRDGDTFRARYRQLGAAISAWNASSRSDADAEVMAGWLRGALRLALARSDRPFPPPPQFIASSSPAEPAVAKPSPRPEPSENVRSIELTVPQVPPAPTAPDASAAVAKDRPTVATASPPDRRSGLPPIYHGAPRPEPTVPPPHIVRRATGEPTGETVAQPPAETRLAESAAPARNDAQTLHNESSPDSDISNTAQGAQAATPGDITASRRKATSGQRDAKSAPVTGGEQTTVAAIDPFRDDPATAEGRSPQAVRPAEQVMRATREERDSTHRVPRVNLAELRARIEGFDRGLRNVESRLMGYESLSAAELIKLARSLDDLLNQREFVALYVGTLSPTERRGLPKLREAEPVVELLSQQIVEKRHALQRRAVLDSDDRRRDWLLLQEASRRLTNLGTQTQANGSESTE